MKIQFWFEFGSTYSYPAALRIEKLAARKGVSIDWRVFLLGPIFKQQGWNDSPFNVYPAKGKYMWRDLERVCQKHKIPYHKPSQFPRNGLLASRIACCYSETPWLPGFIKAVFQANFEYDLDIASSTVIEKCLTRLQLDPAEILQNSQLPATKEKLRNQTNEAVDLGIFGAPTVMVGTEMFWGDDRLEDALEWCRDSK